MRQLALPFTTLHRLTNATLVRGPANEEALAWLDRPETWPNHRLAIHGPAHAGKTHLLHAFAERHSGILLPGLALRHLPILPQDGPIAIDDADFTPDPEPLLHLLNAAAEARLPVLLAARTPPASWPVSLPDLASRLRAITTAPVARPTDDMLAALLNTLAAERQLQLPQQIQSYLLTRLPRNAAALHEAAARLDRAALAHGGRVTRAVAAGVLADMGAMEAADAEDDRKQTVLF